MDTRNSSILLLAAGIFTLSLTGCTAGKSSQRINVLFIIVDDMKPAIGCFGDTKAITPNIDSLASRATVFTHAYCQQALSGPSRASLFTGLRPESAGVTELDSPMRNRPNIITMPQAFKNNGYETRSIGKTFHGERNTLDSLSWSAAPVFYRYSKSDEYQMGQNKTGKKAAAYEFTDMPEEQYLDIRIRNEALKQLEELSNGDKKFFMVVGFLKPHLPFCAPKRFLDLYKNTSFEIKDTSRIKGAPAVAYHNSEELRGYTDITDTGSIGSKKEMDLKKAYYACVSYTDENIGRLIDRLKELGQYDNTVIIIAGDHGFHTGEQGLWGKSTNYEEACHAPLIIKGIQQKTGAIVSTPIEFIDIFPTIADLCKINIEYSLQGKNILNLDCNNHYAFSQFPRPYKALHDARHRTHMGYAVRDSAWRYIEWYDNNGQITDRELYYLRKFSAEKTNIANNERAEAIVDRLADTLHSVFLVEK